MLLRRKDKRLIKGELSTEHASSSYGQPVLVLPDGSALGPGDLWNWDIKSGTWEERIWCVKCPGITLPELARRAGRALRTVQAAAARLELQKRGRDYALMPSDAEALMREMKTGPGRPRKLDTKGQPG